MRALVVEAFGAPPRLTGDRPAPAPGADDALVEVLAAPLNPADLLTWSGTYHLGRPPLPYVAGCEAVGRVVASPLHAPGTLVWTGWDGGLGVSRDGCIAELVAAPAAELVPLPPGVDVARAAALGVAGLSGWLPLAERAPVVPGETVLVLGATGTVGGVAVQAARLLGAGRVVAAGRRADVLERRLAQGADAAVVLDDGDDLAERLRAACGGDGPTLVLDAVWGRPLAAALEASAPHARIVHLGRSAGDPATLPSGPIRGKELSILGWSGWLPRDVVGAAYLRLLDLLADGRLAVDVEEVPLADAAAAWGRLAAGGAPKLVVRPG